MAKFSTDDMVIYLNNPRESNGRKDRRKGGRERGREKKGKKHKIFQSLVIKLIS